MHVKDLGIHLYHSCADASGSPAESLRRPMRHMKPGFSGIHLPDANQTQQVPRWSSAGGGVVWGQEALRRAACSTGSDLCSWAEA